LFPAVISMPIDAISGSSGRTRRGITRTHVGALIVAVGGIGVVAPYLLPSVLRSLIASVGLDAIAGLIGTLGQFRGLWRFGPRLLLPNMLASCAVIHPGAEAFERQDTTTSRAGRAGVIGF
jgi:hypothetical protein